MCGIVGYIGKETKIKTILSKLQKLEYRGYDSSGVAYHDGAICVQKTVGTIDKVFDSIIGKQSKVIICHTRWATHGAVNQTNAHPHVSYAQNFVVVHNGIIENYNNLKDQIGTQKFVSTTDTEVVANLLETQSGNSFQKFNSTIDKLVGSWAILMFDKSGDKIYAAKNKSPLYAAVTKNGILFASDITCFDGANYYVFDDGMTAVASTEKIEFFMGEKQVYPKLQKNTFKGEQTSKENFKFFMQKEIYQTPQVLQNIASGYQKIAKTKHFASIFSKKCRVLLCGCGTAYHAAQLGAKWISRNRKIFARAIVSSEMRYFGKISKNEVVFLISQSGETADTLAVLQKAKQKQAKVVAITNCLHSTLARESNVVLPLYAGEEVAVASTKALSAMLAVLYLLSSKNTLLATKKLKQFAKALEVKPVDNQIVEQIASSKRIFFIGRGDDSVVASEGALKLKETCYLDSYGYYAGELKHGTIALVEQGVYIVALTNSKQTASKTMGAVHECLSRGANAICVGKYGGEQIQNNISTNTKTPTCLSSIESVIILQMLSCQVADYLGTNPDRPKNLAKSVTVE